MLFEDTEIKSQSLTNSLTERASDKVTYWAVLDSKKGEKEGGANGEHQNDEEGGVLHMMMFDERQNRFGNGYENLFLVQ